MTLASLATSFPKRHRRSGAQARTTKRGSHSAVCATASPINTSVLRLTRPSTLLLPLFTLFDNWLQCQNLVFNIDGNRRPLQVSTCAYVRGIAIFLAFSVKSQVHGAVNSSYRKWVPTAKHSQRVGTRNVPRSILVVRKKPTHKMLKRAIPRDVRYSAASAVSAAASASAGASSTGSSTGLPT